MVKKTGKKKYKKTKKQSHTEKVLINNFISLQKVLTNLVVKFDELSTNMSKLLQLFEISAKSFVEKYNPKEIGIEPQKTEKDDKELLKKLDSLLDQNKTIAKGILLMEDNIRRRIHHEPRPVEGQIRPSPLQRM